MNDEHFQEHNKRRDILDNLLRFRRKSRDSMAEGGEDYNHIKEQENLGQEKGVKPKIQPEIRGRCTVRPLMELVLLA